MKIRILLGFVFAAVASFTALTASADTLTFTLDNTATATIYSWQLPSSPTPSEFDPSKL